jgi:chemosensory pili system protein ChpA (sensor histidine kinase/response regulator)
VGLTNASNRTVLIVEDEELCAATLEIALLALPDVDVQLAASATQALRLLQSGRHVDALVTDLHLPTMDGFELIERVRSDSRTAQLPIVVISGDPDPDVCDRVYQLGADAFFGKPYSTARVRQKVEELLELYARPTPA